MPDKTGHNQDGSHQPVDVVDGHTFDGVPYQIALEPIVFDHGWSASIHKGKMLGHHPLVVAVKVFGGMLDPVRKKLLIRELKFVAQVSLSHHFILGFLGTADVGEQTAIVSLYMRNGNMMVYMKANPGCKKKKLILQVAEAVEFLHDSKGLVHGDIKCTNVLISDFGDALLTDFGLSTVAEKSQSRTATLTTIRQMNTLHFAAPEVLLGEGPATLSKTRESDVYAFGMLILEAISERPPWGMESDFAVMWAVCSGQHPERPTLDDAFVSIGCCWWEICCDCWESEPDYRPPIRHVLSRMRNAAVYPGKSRVLPFQERICSATYTPDGSTLVAVSDADSIVLFDIATGDSRDLPHDFEDPDADEYMKVAISPDGRCIACCVQGEVTVLDAASGVQVTSMSHGRHFPSSVAYSRDGTRIASGASNGIVRLWDAATGAALGQELIRHRPRCRVCVLSFSPDGICLASVSEGSTDGSIHLWDSMACTLMGTLTVGDSPIRAMEFSPAGTHIIAGDQVGRVFICDARERRTTHTFETHWGPIHHVTVALSGRYVASAHDNGGIGIWDLQDGSQVADTLEEATGSVHSVAFSPDEKSLVSVADDWSVRIWDLSE